jgi:large subunit ribosomal protein L1
MAKLTKKQKEISSFVTESKIHGSNFELTEALSFIRKYQSQTKFTSKKSVDWSMDVVFDTHVEPGKTLNSSLVLPHGNGKKIKLIVFCDPSDVTLAKQLGAVDAGSDDLIEKVLAGFNDFDKCVATQAVFANVSKKLARILGPKNLLPSLKAGTVSANLTAMVKDVLGGQVSLRASKTGTVATSIGRVSFSDEKIIENVNALIAKVKSLKPEGLKSAFIKSASISTTMGFGVDLKIS